MATVDKIFDLLAKQMAGGKEDKLKGARDLFSAFEEETKALSNGSRLALSAVAGLSDSFFGLESKAFSATSAMRLLPLELAKLAVALTEIGIAAAQARREQHIQARAIGTTATSMDSLTNFFRVFKVGDAKAKEMAGASAGAASGILKSAKSGDESALEKLKKAEIVGFDGKTGKARDTALIAAEAVQKGESFRALAKEAEDKGDKGRAEEYRAKENSAFEIAGMSDEYRSRIVEAKIAPRAIPDLFASEQSKRPSLTQDEEARFQRISNHLAQITNNFGAVSEGAARMFANFGARLADLVMPALLGFSEGLLKIAKLFGIIKESPQEIEGREKKEAAQREAYDKSLKEFEDSGGVRAPEGYSTEPFIGAPENKESQTKPNDKLSSNIPSVDSALGNMNYLFGSNQLELQAASVTQAASQQAGYSNVGNDQRQTQITMNTNVAVNTPAEAANEIRSGVSYGVAMMKEINGGTTAVDHA